MNKTNRQSFIDKCLVGGDHDKLNRYFYLLSRLSSKKKQYGGFLENDLKYSEQKGGKSINNTGGSRGTFEKGTRKKEKRRKNEEFRKKIEIIERRSNLELYETIEIDYYEIKNICSRVTIAIVENEKLTQNEINIFQTKIEKIYDKYSGYLDKKNLLPLQKDADLNKKILGSNCAYLLYRFFNKMIDQLKTKLNLTEREDRDTILNSDIKSMQQICKYIGNSNMVDDFNWLDDIDMINRIIRIHSLNIEQIRLRHGRDTVEKSCNIILQLLKDKRNGKNIRNKSN